MREPEALGPTVSHPGTFRLGGHVKSGTATPTRVVHFLWRLSPGGGIPIVVRQLAAGLDPARFDVHLVTARPLLEEDGVAGGRVGHATVHGLGITGKAGRPQQALLASRLARCVHALDPDVLHVHSGSAAYALPAVLRARPRARVLEVHDAPGSGRHGRAAEWCEGQLVRRLRFVPLVHSTSVRDDVSAAYGVDRGAAAFVPLGVDAVGDVPVPGAGAAWRRRIGVARGAPLVLCVARLVPTKNIALVVEVADQLRDHPALPTFVVVGNGPESDRLAREIDNRGLAGRVMLGGALYGADLRAAYDAADVLLSTSDYEGFGLTVVEAMAAGLPVVATAVGGVTDLVVHGETGFLAPRGDAAALAGAVARLIDDAALRVRMATGARARARERFDARATVDGVAALYARLSRPPDTVRVAVLKSPDFEAWRRENGQDAGLPYRIDHLKSAALTLDWTDANHRAPFTYRPVAAAIKAQTRRAPPVVQAALLAPRIVRSDVTLAMFESEANFLAWARHVGIPPFRHIRVAVITCWLAELLRHASQSRRTWYRKTYRVVDRLIAFSSNQVAILSEQLDLPAERVRFVPFGVDEGFFAPVDGDDRGYVLAAGRDRGRDWATTFAAVAGTGLAMKVLCRPKELGGLDVPANVEVLGYADRRTYRDLLGRAAVVVVATHDLAYPSGQSVFLEAAAMGRACVVTGTAAMADYLRAGDNAIGVPPGDPAALREAISALLDDKADRAALGARARADVEARFTARRMWSEIGAELRAIVAEAPVSDVAAP